MEVSPKEDFPPSMKPSTALSMYDSHSFQGIFLLPTLNRELGQYDSSLSVASASSGPDLGCWVTAEPW